MGKGVLTVVSGFSGAGKGTMVRELLKRYDDYCLSVSATTRAPRQGEIDGVHYFFISKEEFEKGIEEGDFLEYNNYLGNYYGTPRKWVEQQIDSGKNIILEIEMHGGLNVKKLYPEARLVFVSVPDMSVLEKRLHVRSTETEEQIRARLDQANDEMKYISDYDIVIVNDNLDESVEKLNSFIKS